MEMSVKEFGKMAKESNDNFFYFNILILLNKLKNALSLSIKIN
jgi:hypothetical protein